MKHVYFFLILLFAALSSTGQTCSNYWAELSPDGQQLYFSSDKAGEGYEIYRSNIDGSNEVRLTNSAGDKYYPMLSPDGTQLLYQLNTYGSSAEIFIMNSDGSGEVQLTNNSIHDGYASFSPDGQTIVFEAWDSSEYPEIFTMNLDGSDRTQLTNNGGAYWQSAPRYNPAGDKIYFSAGFNADNNYMMMDLDGSNWVFITPANTFGYSDWALDFNADGSKIIFFTTEWKGYNNGCDQVIADSDGSNWEQITMAADGEYFYQSTFHPNGNDLYYSYYYPGVADTWEIHKMDITGDNSIPVSDCVVTSLDELETVLKGVYPNPATESVRIELPDHFDSGMVLEIHDMNGRVVWAREIPVGKAEVMLEVGEWARGLYTIQVKSGSEIHRTKLILSD